MDKNCRKIFFVMLPVFVVLGSSAFAMYDTHTGRFLTQDPLGYVDGMNLYEYVADNPIIEMDPSGLSRNSCEKDCRTWAVREKLAAGNPGWLRKLG